MLAILYGKYFYVILIGLGNSTAAAEFNFYADPEAASICIDSYPPCRLTILPWETGLKAASTYVGDNKYLYFSCYQKRVLWVMHHVITN